MVDKERVLTKIDELQRYLKDLKRILPSDFPGYQEVEKKRSCERLLQLSIECTIDICKLLVMGLKLGVPAGEDDIFDKVTAAKILDAGAADVLKKMRGLRNILVHEYAEVDDELIFGILSSDLNDFDVFISRIKDYLRRGDSC